MAATFQEHQGDRTDYKMATITITTDFAPEIWEQIKEYAGIFPLPANIVHFDKLTFEELKDSIDDIRELNPFALLGIDSVYSVLTYGEKWNDIYDDYENDPLLQYSGGKYFDGGEEVKAEEKKEMLVNVIQNEYYRRTCGWEREDKIEFWNKVSELITECFKKREEKKEDAKKKRAAAKARKETPKGMIAEINKIENERRRLMKRRKDDKEKLDKLTIKGDEWRAKLNKKRDEIRYSNDKK